MIAQIKKGAVTYLKDLRLLTPNARKYLTGSFFIAMTFSSFMLLLNLYLRERSYGEADIGSILSAGAIGMTLVSVPGALILSRVKLKPILLTANIMYPIFGLIAVYSLNFWAIWFAYLFAGMSMAFFRVASSPFFMRNSSPKERPYLFSLSFGIMVIAGTIGSFAFGNLVHFFADNLGYDSIWAHRLAMTVGISMSLFALIPFSLLKMPKKIPAEDKLNLSKKMLLSMKGKLLRLTLPYFVVGTGAGMIIPFLNLFFRDRFGQSPDEIGYYFGVVNLTMFIGVMAGPVLVKKIGMVRTMVYSQLASIPFMLILAYSYYFPLVFVAFLFRGALMNMGHPIGNNFAMEMVPKSFHGIVNALLMLAWTSSWMVSTKIGGIVIENYGYTLSLNIAIVLYVISSVMYFISFRNSEKHTPDGFVVKPDFKMTP
ncbi:MAG: MFS transporter [candidate division Zixibacteria bacterium]|nr:MFS transporter [candidate division Zixibacteria bacterium]